MDSKTEITFTIDFTFFLSQSRRFKTLPTLGTSEAVFVPGLEETNEYKFERPVSCSSTETLRKINPK